MVAFAFAVVAGASGIVISRYDSSHPARTSPGVPRIWGWNPEGVHMAYPTYRRELLTHLLDSAVRRESYGQTP